MCFSNASPGCHNWNFAGAQVHGAELLGNLLCQPWGHGQKSNHKFSSKCIFWLEKKTGICNGVPSTEV